MPYTLKNLTISIAIACGAQFSASNSALAEPILGSSHVLTWLTADTEAAHAPPLIKDAATIIKAIDLGWDTKPIDDSFQFVDLKPHLENTT